MFTCVFPEQQRERAAQAAVDAGLLIVRTRPVVFREGEPPLVRLFSMMRREDLPARLHGNGWEEPPLVIRTASGTVHPEYAAVKLSVGLPP